MEQQKTNPDCALCRAIKEGSKKVYEDDKVVAMLSETPCTPGHVVIAPKNHSPIIEEVPDPVVAHAFQVANKLSTVIFEQLGAHGTNIFVQNGVSAGQELPHFTVNVIPRRENDNLPIQWQPTEVPEDQLSTLELQIKEESKNIGAFEQEKQAPIEVKKEEQVISGEEDYRIKHLKRLP